MNLTYRIFETGKGKLPIELSMAIGICSVIMVPALVIWPPYMVMEAATWYCRSTLLVESWRLAIDPVVMGPVLRPGGSVRLKFETLDSRTATGLKVTGKDTVVSRSSRHIPERDGRIGHRRRRRCGRWRRWCRRRRWRCRGRIRSGCRHGDLAVRRLFPP